MDTLYEEYKGSISGFEEFNNLLRIKLTIIIKIWLLLEKYRVRIT